MSVVAVCKNEADCTVRLLEQTTGVSVSAANAEPEVEERPAA